MRKIDVGKFDSKAAKTINFDYVVLVKLEERARVENITVSELVNEILKRAIMSDNQFYMELAKYHNAMFYHYKSLAGELDKK